MKGRIEIDKERCKGCGLCITVCPKHNISISEEINAKGYYPASFQDSDVEGSEQIQCTGCSMCAITCPDVAIEVYREGKDDQEQGQTESD